MSLDTDRLPRFRNPPVDEVAVGVQFTLQGFLPTHYGRFHERIKGDYPGVQFLPPLPPQVEVVPGSPAFSPPFLGFPPLPRVLFVSGDDASLVQLQRDRLYFNWRKRRLSEYPHYASFRDAFSRIYTAFEGFLADEGIGSIQPFQCDILYVNSLSAETTGTKPSSPEKVFRCWNTALGEEWQTPLEDISFNSRYRLVDENDQPFGRLIVGMSTVGGTDRSAQMRLELTARGTARGSGLAGVLAFHDAGHEAIVRCFAAMTTSEMHKRWGRFDHE